MTLAPYNRIEQGHSAALIDSLIRIADAIGVPLADLVREQAPASRRGAADRGGREAGYPRLSSRPVGSVVWPSLQ
ncbi:hypothetical protein GA0115254_100736 [Streptomyces sp. Ncost-T10-10d]|nr:hypothetical protein GA0115254_100736 [Streptomyces sp. Ncost-T10-10d]